jgi:hypothetical protein
MKTSFLALSILILAVSNAQAGACNNAMSLEPVPHPACHPQIRSLVPETCSSVYIRGRKPPLTSFNLTALATKPCPAVSLKTTKHECRSVRGKFLIEPQCSPEQLPTLDFKKVTKSLNIRSESSVSRTSNIKKDADTVKRPISSVRSCLVNSDSSDLRTCPKSKELMAGPSDNFQGNIKNGKKTVHRVSPKPVFPIKA